MAAGGTSQREKPGGATTASAESNEVTLELVQQFRGVGGTTLGRGWARTELGLEVPNASPSQ